MNTGSSAPNLHCSADHLGRPCDTESALVCLASEDDMLQHFTLSSIRNSSYLGISRSYGSGGSWRPPPPRTEAENRLKLTFPYFGTRVYLGSPRRGG